MKEQEQTTTDEFITDITVLELIRAKALVEEAVLARDVNLAAAIMAVEIVHAILKGDGRAKEKPDAEQRRSIALELARGLTECRCDADDIEAIEVSLSDRLGEVFSYETYRRR